MIKIDKSEVTVSGAGGRIRAELTALIETLINEGVFESYDKFEQYSRQSHEYIALRGEGVSSDDALDYVGLKLDDTKNQK